MHILYMIRLCVVLTVAYVGIYTWALKAFNSNLVMTLRPMRVLHMYVHLFVCMCVYLYIYIYIYVCEYFCIYVYNMYIHIYVYMRKTVCLSCVKAAAAL